MDKKGALYFAVKTESGLVKVLRVDPNEQMGTASFIKSVFSIRCDYIHFLEIRNDFFYLMDEKKKIRKLVQDTKTFMLKQDTTLEISKKDMINLKYTDFDEYFISSELMHWDHKTMYYFENQNNDDFTWGECNIMAENH